MRTRNHSKLGWTVTPCPRLILNLKGAIRSRMWALWLPLLIWAAGPDATGASTRVEMRQNGNFYFFTPTNISIHLGETVTWTNTDSNAHDTSHHPPSGTGLWASPLISSLTPGNSFS